MGRVTLQTIADEIGVSRTTVSNAFSRPDQLSPSLRQRVMAAAARLGYAGPDPAARSLRTGRTGSIGLLLTESLSYAFDDGYAMQVLQGLAAATQGDGLALLLVPTPPDHSVGEAVDMAAVDAFCIYAMPHGHPAVDRVISRGRPTLVLDMPRLAGHPFIGVDDEAAGYDAVGHLCARGRRRIGLVTFRLHLDDYVGPVTPERLAAATFDIARDRITGGMRAAEAAGASVVVHEAGTTAVESGRRTAHALLDTADPPDAIFAVADKLAIGVLQAAAERGLAVPDDLAVVGFDDLPLAAANDLTSVAQPAREKGAMAGRWLVAGTTGPRHEVLPTTLVVRGSSGG